MTTTKVLSYEILLAKILSQGRYEDAAAINFQLIVLDLLNRSIRGINAYLSLHLTDEMPLPRLTPK